MNDHDRDSTFSPDYDPPPESALAGIIFGMIFGAVLWGLLTLAFWRMGWY